MSVMMLPHCDLIISYSRSSGALNYTLEERDKRVCRKKRRYSDTLMFILCTSMKIQHDIIMFASTSS